MGSRKIPVTLFFILLALLFGIAATQPPKGRYKNLQILPKDITERDMDSIMLSYTKALGMGCGFCHTPLKDYPDSLDYADDKNEMKANARGMMRMTIDINKKYFYFDTTRRVEYLNVVHCNTCHRGEPYPIH
jgi:hypothetical protein